MADVAFYKRGGELVSSTYRAPGVPRKGEIVVLAKTSWRVEGVTWTTEKTNSPMHPTLMAKVEIVPIESDN